MNYIFASSILIVGLSGLVAQVLLLRELLVSFYGNELTIGIILANWIVSEALGVLIIGKFIDRIKNKINVFIILQLLFSLTLPLSIYFARIFKILLGITFGEGIGLYAIFYSSFFIILPVSFCHGALFSCACKIYSTYVKEAALSIGKVYAWETLGTLLGGLIVTFLFIPYLSSFQIAWIICISNLLVCLFFFKGEKKIFRYITLFVIFLAGFLYFAGIVDKIQRFSIDRQWKHQQVLDYRNSIYGNITVTKQLEQYTFFYNGIPVITSPYPDKQFVEDFGHLPLLFQRNPKQILIISTGAGGLINEILKHPIEKIDYLEIDPLIISMLKIYPTRLTESELNDSRVNIINLDARYFLRTRPVLYDSILIGLSSQSDLSTNRFFTQEFFSLVKTRLKPDGILAFWLPGSLAYLSAELKNINACILDGAKAVFDYVRIIPGDYNIFLASDSKDIMNVSSELISKRILEQNIQTSILVPSYLDYRLSKYWMDWFTQALTGSTKEVNLDLKPIAVFETLKLWNKKFSPGVAYILSLFKNLNLNSISLFILLIFILLFNIIKRPNRKNLSIVYAIATTGFFGMLANLILIFGFQVFYGYLYRWLGILISVFMGGIALGSMAMVEKIKKLENQLRCFVRLELLIIIFSLLMALTMVRLSLYTQNSSFIFIALFLIAGFLLGLEFPLASIIYLGKRQEVGGTTGVLYSADLFGGWLAGILGGIVLIPVLGLFNTCMIIVVFKLSSLLLLTLIYKVKI